MTDSTVPNRNWRLLAMVIPWGHLLLLKFLAAGKSAAWYLVAANLALGLGATLIVGNLIWRERLQLSNSARKRDPGNFVFSLVLMSLLTGLLCFYLVFIWHIHLEMTAPDSSCCSL